MSWSVLGLARKGLRNRYCASRRLYLIEEVAAGCDGGLLHLSKQYRLRLVVGGAVSSGTVLGSGDS